MPCFMYYLIWLPHFTSKEEVKKLIKWMCRGRRSPSEDHWWYRIFGMRSEECSSEHQGSLGNRLQLSSREASRHYSHLFVGATILKSVKAYCACDICAFSSLPAKGLSIRDLKASEARYYRVQIAILTVTNFPTLSKWLQALCISFSFVN